MQKFMSRTKRCTALVLLLGLLIAAATITASAANPAPPFIGAFTNASFDNLTMRNGPGTSHAQVGPGIPKGAEVAVMAAKSCDDGTSSRPWYFLKYTAPDRTEYYGYAASRPITYVRPMKPGMPFIGKVVTGGSPLNMRSGPSVKHGKVTEIPIYSEVTVLSFEPCDNGSKENPVWYYIEYQGKRGYVATQYVEFVRDTNPPKPSVPDPGKPTPSVKPGTILDHSAPMPDFYKPYLAGIQRRHPKWKFVFYDTGLDWNTVVQEESKAWQTDSGWHSKSLVSGSMPLSYRLPSIQTIPVEGKSWFAADPKTVSYFMDPRNSMTDARLFQFEAVSYDPTVQTLAGVQKMLSRSHMANKTLETYDHRTITYAEAIMEAAQQSGASPYFLASRIIQETGYSGSGSVSGTYPGHEGYYNFYNIGAATKGDTVANALKWAASTDANEIKNAGRPWTTPYQSIVEGAKWISRSYIAKGQDTLYYQKFDLVPPKPFGHQYMTNIAAPYGESTTVYKNYNEMQMLDYPFLFKIPVYRNMPSIQHLPDFDTKDYYGRRRGDATGDGQLTLADYQQLKEAAAQWNYTAADAQDFIVRDLNDDRAVDAFDAALLDRLIAN